MIESFLAQCIIKRNINQAIVPRCDVSDGPIDRVCAIVEKQLMTS